MSRSALHSLAVACCVAALLSGAGPTRSFAADEQVTTEESAKACIADLDAGFKEDDGRYFFQMSFQNNCDKPIRCTVDAYITGYRGPVSAHAELHFPAKEQTPTQKSYAVSVKAAGGMAQYGRDCSFQ